jgi:SAM-dependent methyltransferase
VKYSPSTSSSIIDIGGGASTLPADLLFKGYLDISILDISQAALDVLRPTLESHHGGDNKVFYYCDDIIAAETLPTNHFDIWHDRAVFHFLTQDAQKQKYVAQVLKSVKSGGIVIMAPFGLEGPLKCSGLEVARYGPDELTSVFGDQFQLQEAFLDYHTTPFNTVQQFNYCVFLKK